MPLPLQHWDYKHSHCTCLLSCFALCALGPGKQAQILILAWVVLTELPQQPRPLPLSSPVLIYNFLLSDLALEDPHPWYLSKRLSMNPGGPGYSLFVRCNRTSNSAKVLVLEAGCILEGTLRRAFWKPCSDRCPCWPVSRTLSKVLIAPATRTQFWLVSAMYTHVWAEFHSCQILTHRQNFCSKHMAGNPQITCSVGTHLRQDF